MSLASVLPSIEADPVATGIAVAAVVVFSVLHVVRGRHR
jgi:hypothetical protein